MKVRVIEIRPSQTAQVSQFEPYKAIGTFDVLVSIGNREYRFELAVDVDVVGERQIQIIRTDINFETIFKFNLKLHRDICKLVSSVYNHQPVKLPIDLGELDIIETEMAKILT